MRKHGRLIAVLGGSWTALHFHYMLSPATMIGADTGIKMPLEEPIRRLEIVLYEAW